MKIKRPPPPRSHQKRSASFAAAILLAFMAAAIGAPRLADAWGDWRCVFGRPCPADLYAVDALSAEVGWSVGEAGIALHRDARRSWRHDHIPVDTLYALTLVSPNEAWAGGSGDRLAHRRFGDWTTVRFEDPSHTGWNVHDMATDASGETGWAVGCAHAWRTDTRYPRSSTGPCEGRALRLSEGGWTPTALEGAPRLLGLALTDGRASQGWAVGEGGWVWRLVDGAWRAHAQIGVFAWRDIAFDGVDRGWAVGDQGALMRFVEGRWEAVESPTSATLYGVDFASADEAWAVGDSGTILHLNRGMWVEVESPTTTKLRAIRMTSPGEGWAVGDDETVLHFANGVWQVDQHERGRPLAPLPPPPTESTLLGLTLDSAGRPLAVGTRGTILRFDGEEWHVDAPADSSTPDLHGVAMLREDSAWAVGNGGTILRYDGRLWQVEAPADGRTPDLRAVEMLSEDFGWAVGLRGAILHFDGKIWWDISGPTRENLHDLALYSSESGWAVGARGTILRFDGRRWRRFESPTSVDLYGVAIVSEDLAWAVGLQGIILRFDGRTWHVDRSPTGHGLSDVAASDSRRAWAVGTSGTIIRFDGVHWQPFGGPTARSPHAIVLDVGGGWAVGDAGIVLRLNEPPATHTLVLPGRRDATSTDLVVQNAGITSTVLSARLLSPDSRAPYEIGYPEVAPGGSKTFWLPTLYELGVGPIAAHLTGGAPLGGVSGSYAPGGRAASVGPLLGDDTLVVPLAVRDYVGQDTTVQVQNLDPTQPVVVTLSLQASGAAGFAHQQELSIAAGRALRIDLGNDPAFSALRPNTPLGFLGSIHLGAHDGGRIAAHAETDVRDSTLARYAYEALPPSSAGTTLLAPLFRSRFHGDTGISVANPNDGPVEVTVTYRGTNHPDNACSGLVRRHGPARIPPRSSAVFYQGAGAARVPLTGDHGLPAGCFGAATIESAGGPVMAIVNDAALDGRGVPTTAAAYVALRPEDGARRLSLPRLRNRQLRWAYSSGVQLMNVGEAPATASIELFDPAGVKQTGCGADCRFTIPPDATHNLTLGFGGLGDPFLDAHGGAIVSSDQPLIGIVNDFALEGAFDTATYNAIGVDLP